MGNFGLFKHTTTAYTVSPISIHSWREINCKGLNNPMIAMCFIADEELIFGCFQLNLENAYFSWTSKRVYIDRARY